MNDDLERYLIAQQTYLPDCPAGYKIWAEEKLLDVAYFSTDNRAWS